MRSVFSLVSFVFLLILGLSIGACGGDSGGDAGGGATGPAADMGVGNMPVQGDLNLVSAEARACDLLFETNGHELSSVSFNTAVEGVFKKRTPKFAVSFTLKGNEPLVGSVASLQLKSGRLSDVQLVSATCFDATGATIEGDSLVSLGAGD